MTGYFDSIAFDNKSAELSEGAKSRVEDLSCFVAANLPPLSIRDRGICPILIAHEKLEESLMWINVAIKQDQRERERYRV